MSHLLFWLGRDGPWPRDRRGRRWCEARKERNRALEAECLQRLTRKPPVGCRRDLAVVMSLSLCQRSHPTRFVAGAGIVRRTSAHKRNPLFHRRAPESNTVVPEGSPGASHARRQETLRIGRRNRRSTGCVYATGQENTFIPSGDTNRWRGTCLCRRRRHARDTPPLAGQCLTTAGNRGMGRTCLTSGRLAGCAPLAGGRTLATGRFDRHGALAVGVTAT